MNQHTQAMDRRSGARIGTDCPLIAYRDGVAFDCRAVELSVGGALIHHGRRRYAPLVQQLELMLAGRRTVRALARTVWSDDHRQAVRFIGLGEVDRLEIAELLDRVRG